MGPTRNQYLILTVFTFSLGLLGAMALRANELVADPAGVESRQGRLIGIVEELEERRDDLEATLAELRDESTALEQEYASIRGLSMAYADELSTLRMLAGLVAVRGPGLAVTIADNPQPPLEGQDPNNYIVHDYDVRIIVNALWEGGAEAISVNGQRLVGTSAVRCVGTTILVNNTRVGSPFEIKATGDSDGLEAALARDDDTRLLLDEYAGLFGLDIDVAPSDDVEIPAYTGSLTPRVLLTESSTEDHEDARR